MIKEIVFSLLFALTTASVHGAATNPVADDATEHINLWEAAEAVIIKYDPIDAYTTLLFTKMVWLYTFGKPCINCIDQNCPSQRFFEFTRTSLLLGRITLDATLEFCTTFECLRTCAKALKVAATEIGRDRLDFHQAGVRFDTHTSVANTQLKAQLTPADHEACVHHIQVSILSP